MSASSSRSQEASSVGSKAATWICSVSARRDFESDSRSRPKKPRWSVSVSAGASESRAYPLSRLYGELDVEDESEAEAA